MPEYLTRRNGFWQFTRRVPLEFAQLDTRGVVKTSTNIAIKTDRTGRKAAIKAEAMNRDLEDFWKRLAGGKTEEAHSFYAQAKQLSKSSGFDLIDSSEIVARATLEAVERIEHIVQTGNNPIARAALLGTVKRPSLQLSELFDRFIELTKAEMRDMSKNQLRIWKNGKRLAASNLISVIGDKPLNEITNDDALDYNEWWQGRVVEKDMAIKTANKDIGHLSRMIKVVNRKHRLGLPDIFAGMRLEGSVNSYRVPFNTEFIQRQIIDSGALMELNDEARRIVLLIADSGLRLSEAANLNASTIFLQANIPYISVKPDGRRIKTEQSERDIPLVGVALAAARLQPNGFPRYVDKGGSLSATVNKFLSAKNLRPSQKHSVYSLRHSFKDRLIAAKAPDSMIDSLMGHKGDTPKYGLGPQLDLKLEWLQQIAFIAPWSL